MVTGLDPARRVWAPGEIDCYMDLNTDVTYPEILARGYYPQMPWSLYAYGVLPLEREQFCRILTLHVFRRLPFSDLANLLDERLEQGFAFLRTFSPEKILANGQIVRRQWSRSQSHPKWFPKLT